MSTPRAVILCALTLACSDVTGPALEDPRIELWNRTGSPVVAVFIVDCASSTWGNNLLRAGQVVGDGQVITFEIHRACVSLMAETADNDLYREFNVRVAAGTTWLWEIP